MTTTLYLKDATRHMLRPLNMQPRLKLMPNCAPHWQCRYRYTATGYGNTPREAYANWARANNLVVIE